jgi:hypothetical protein
VGAEAQVLEVLSAAGTVVSRELTGDGRATVEFELDVHEPTYLVAVARGTTHANVPYRRVYAHTSPVHIQLGGESVGRAEDARWCLEWLDRFEERVLAHGVFHRADHRDDLLDVSHRARRFYEDVVARDLGRQAAAESGRQTRPRR